MFVTIKLDKISFTPYNYRAVVADVVINLWGRDLLQQWRASLNIPTLSQAT